MKLFVVVALLSQASMSFADGMGFRPGYGRPGYGGYPGYGHRQGDADGAVAIIIGVSATLLSLSALDNANRGRHIAAIQQAETEALAFDGTTQPSPVFLNAKKSVETLQGQNLTDEQAAETIVELNQEFRN